MTKTEEGMSKREPAQSVAGRFLAMHISILPTKDALNLSRGVLLLTAAAPPDGKRSQPARESEKARLEQSERGWRDEKRESWSGRRGKREQLAFT